MMKKHDPRVDQLTQLSESLLSWSKLGCEAAFERVAEGHVPDQGARGWEPLGERVDRE